MKQQNAELIERWTRSNNPQPPQEEVNQLSSRSVERPALLDEVEELVKNTQMHLDELRQEAEVHAQILQDFQKELDTTSTENEESDSDERKSIGFPEKSLQGLVSKAIASVGERLKMEAMVFETGPNNIQYACNKKSDQVPSPHLVESAYKEVKTKALQFEDKEEDEKKDEGAEKLLNTGTIQSNKNKTQAEEKLDAKHMDEKDTDAVQDKSKEKKQLMSDERVHQATEKLLSLKADIAKTLEGLQNVKKSSIELPDSGRKLQYRKQSDEQNRTKIDRPCRAKQLETQGEDIAAEKSKAIDKNRHSKMEVHKVQSLDNIDNISVDTNKQCKTKLHKTPSLENMNKETVDKIRHSKKKLDEIQRLENAATVSEAEPKNRQIKSYKSQTTEDVVNTSDKEKHSRKDHQETIHQAKHSNRKHRKHKYLNEVPPTPACSCSSLMNQEFNEPQTLLSADQIERSDKMSERHTAQSKDIQEVMMSHKTSQTTSNTSVIHIKEEVRSTVEQVHNTKHLTVQQLPSLNIRRTLSVQKVPSVQIPPPGAAAYVSPRQNIAFWGMSEDGAAVEVQKYGSSTNVNDNANTVKEQQQQEVLTLEEPALPQWRDNFTETEMYTWFCEACRSISETNVNITENQYLSQCKECLRHFPTSELFQQHCIECQVVKTETRLDQCVKCLCSVPSTEIINNHCLKCQNVKIVRFYQDTSKPNRKKQHNLQISQIEKIDLPGKESDDNKYVLPGKEPKDNKYVLPGKEPKDNKYVLPGKEPKVNKYVLPGKEPKDNKDVSNVQQQRNVFSYTVQRKEVEHEADSKKEIKPAHPSKSVKPTSEYSRNDYQIKGDIVSSLGEEEIMKELESYLAKEFLNVDHDFPDVTGHHSDVSSLEEYLHSKGQDMTCDLSDTELGELILNSLSARLQQQTDKSREWKVASYKAPHEQIPITMVFRAETSEGSDHSGKNSPRSQRPKSAPDRQPCNERPNSSSSRESPVTGTKAYTQSKYHQHCFDSVIYPVEPAKINYPTFKSKKTLTQKSPTNKKRASSNGKQVKQSKSPEKAVGQVAKRTPRQLQEQDMASKIEEEEESKNKLGAAADTDNDADYETDNGPVTSIEEHGDYGKMTEESYEDDWEEESEHSVTEGVKPQAEVGTQTDSVPSVDKQPSQGIKSDRATSPVDDFKKGMISVDVQTSVISVSPPTSESLPPSEATLPAAAAILVNKLQNACRCSPNIEATDQALDAAIDEKQMCSLADKLQILCKCPAHPPEVPRVTMVDKETSTENDNILVDTPTSPIHPNGNEVMVLCMSPSTCRVLHKTVANATNGAQKVMFVDKATSPRDKTFVQGEKTVRIVTLPTSDKSEASGETSPVSAQTSLNLDQAECVPTTCPVKIRQSRSQQGFSSTDDESNKISGPGSSDDETTTSQTHSEPITSTENTDSGETQSCYCDHGTVSQGEVLFDMQPSEGEVLLNTSREETLSTEAVSESVLNVVNLKDSQRWKKSEDDDVHSDGEISEGQVFLP